MKRFKQLLTEITMNNPGVMFLLEGRGTFGVEAKGKFMKKYLNKYFKLPHGDELNTFLTSPGQTIELPKNAAPSDGSERKVEDPEYGIFLNRKREKTETIGGGLKNHNITTLHNIGGMIHASGPGIINPIPLNTLHKPTKNGGQTKGHKFENAIADVFNKFKVTEHARPGGPGRAKDFTLKIKRTTENPSTSTFKTGDLNVGDLTAHAVKDQGNANITTDRTPKDIEIKLNKDDVVLSQLTLNHDPSKGGWHSPDEQKTDPRMKVTRRLLQSTAHPNGKNFLDHINATYKSSQDIKAAYNHDPNHTIPQHDSMESTNLRDAQEHLASKNDFLIVGPAVYTLNPEIHAELRRRGIPSTMLHHDENENEGKFVLHSRIKEPTTGNVNISMRFTSLHPSEAVLSPTYLKHLRNYVESAKKEGGTTPNLTEISDFEKIIENHIPKRKMRKALADAIIVKTTRELKEEANFNNEQFNKGNIK